MDQILKLYDKEDDPRYGIYKIALQEVADALGYKESTASNGKPYYRILHELTAEYLSKNKDYISAYAYKDDVRFNTKLYNKNAFLILAMMSNRYQYYNWSKHKRLMKDHNAYIGFCVNRCCPTSSHEEPLYLETVEITPYSEVSVLS